LAIGIFIKHKLAITCKIYLHLVTELKERLTAVCSL
jgi:hypothetical protein